MCGIFGFNKFEKQELETARLSLHTLTHRGPDQWNEHVDNSVYMGHRRLSILDLSEQGKQPMTDRDNKVVITVNGEIYNFKTLRNELEVQYNFISQSDSEVILYGYMEWGIDELLNKIDGMYAFAIYDKEANLIYLARDRVGIKPLYYSTYNNKIAWASELKALERFYSGHNLEKDYTAYYDFLTYLYVPTPKTIYKHFYKLEPAHYLQIDVETATYTKKCYWSLKADICRDGIDEAKTKIRSLISKSTEEQMIADVPVGFFLSGGMDSSAVVGIASEKFNNINTFSIGFSDREHDETEYADIVAEYFKTNHHKRILEQGETASMFGKIKEWYDEPFGDTSCFPTFLVSSFAKENSTVVLTGDGGDEIFGGYNWYTMMKKRRFTNAAASLRQVVDKIIYKRGIVGKIASRFRLLFILDDLEAYTKLMGGLLRSEKEYYRKLWKIDDNYDDYWYFRKHYKPELPHFRRLQYLDFHTYLPDDILTKVDRVSMSVALECRVPLLSRDIIEYVFSLEEDVLIYKGALKGAMKESFRNLLPSEIISRRKKGFSIPRKWLASPEQKLSKQEKILSLFLTLPNTKGYK